ncbi:MAG: flagellar filament capping protein FliD [Pseudobdellovibrionaceae bacterium]
MAGVRISGMASGLPPDIVEQLMNAERMPLKNLETKKAKLQDTEKLVVELETKVSDINKNLGELTNTRGFSDLKLISGDPSIVDGTVDPEAVVTGDYGIEVVQLATKPGAMSNGFPDKNETQVGVGYIKFETSSGTKEVYINPENSTLEGMATSINSAGYGLRATVVEDRKDKENPFKLLVTGITTGDDKQVSFPTIYFLDGDEDFYFDQNRPAQNAKVKVDGFEVEVPENTVTDLIPGVTLNLKQAAVGREIKLNVKENLETISGKIKTFVDSYNAALSFIQNQHKLSKGQDGKERLGPLGGDSMIRQVENSLRRVIMAPQYSSGSQIARIQELGIEFTRNGTLSFNQEKFTKVLNANPKGIATFLRGDGFQTGFVTALKRETSFLLGTSFGAISNRKKSIGDRISRMDQQIENKERQLTRKEEQLVKKFGDLEAKMSNLQRQGGAVAAMAGGGQK